MTEHLEQASFNQMRNDMHWSLYAGEDGIIRWTGYDDRNWWDNVAPTDHARIRVGKVTGRTFRLDHRNCEVTIRASQGQSATQGEEL
jgi:hypothetical protein